MADGAVSLEMRMKALLCGGLDAEDAQQLIFEVERGIPASHSKLKMNPQVLAFRARLVTEMAEVRARGGFVQLAPELLAPPRRSASVTTSRSE